MLRLPASFESADSDTVDTDKLDTENGYSYDRHHLCTTARILSICAVSGIRVALTIPATSLAAIEPNLADPPATFPLILRLLHHENSL